MPFINSEYYPWKEWSNERCKAFAAGYAAPLDATVILEEEKDTELLQERLSTYFKTMEDFQSGYCESDEFIVVWADLVRGYPVFYGQNESTLFVSSNASCVKEKLSGVSVDIEGALQFAMAGYVTGRETVYKKLCAVQPGEFLLFDKKAAKLSAHRYHNYKPSMTVESDRAENVKKLGAILDALTQKIIKRAEGRKIWVPLSAGLDSRIILCKLHEHGCKNIETFTYGPRWNFEALFAKKIAKTLGVKWQMITPSRRYLRKIFESDERRNYWDHAGGLKAIPSMREFSALHYLKSTGQLGEGDIFINGQSGDYITGAHIPPEWENREHLTLDDFYRKVYAKHYSFWPELRVPENLEIIKSKVDSLTQYDLPSLKTKEEICAAYENWEYDGRQVCLVINGQRSYEFFGYDWEMPLWEKALVDFYEDIPLAQKWNQNLYKSYLCAYNYYGLFPEKEPYLWRWPIPMLWVVPMAKLIEFLAGQKYKTRFYALMTYFGHYANQWAFYPFSLHKRFAQKVRTMASLYIRTWFEEHPDAITPSVRKALEIDNAN